VIFKNIGCKNPLFATGMTKHTDTNVSDENQKDGRE
jgi:hypothetical protein